MRTQPHRGQFQQSLACLGDGAAEQRAISIAGGAQVGANIMTVARRGEVDDPAQERAQSVQGRKRKGGCEPRQR